MDLDDNVLCICGEGIDQHTSVHKYLMCPDNIHEFEPSRCDECGEAFTTRSERAEVAPKEAPFETRNSIVHAQCYLNHTDIYELA